MDDKNQTEQNKPEGIRAGARTSYTVKRSPALDVAAGIVSVVLALAVWFFAG